jgi:hypothetical protein
MKSHSGESDLMARRAAAAAVEAAEVRSDFALPAPDTVANCAVDAYVAFRRCVRCGREGTRGFIATSRKVEHTHDAECGNAGACLRRQEKHMRGGGHGHGGQLAGRFGSTS